MTTFKNTLLRSTALAGAAAGLAMVSPAQAATLNSITGFTVTDVNNACRIAAVASFTGVNTDQTITSGPIDWVQSDVSDINGTPGSVQFTSGGNGVAFNAPIGSTVSVNAIAQFRAVPGSVSGDLYLNVYEATSAAGPRSAILGQVLITQAMLNAAGGDCLFLLPNNPPVSNAGADVTVAGGATVGLAGTASDPDNQNQPLTYQWTQTSGPTVSLNGATTLTPSFVAPAKTSSPQILTFSFVANDGMASSAPDSVTVTVPANVGPTANAGPDQNVLPDSTVTLNGFASTDGDGDPITYQWTQTGGPAVALSNPASGNPIFTAPPLTAAAQVMTFDLVVSDGITTSTDSVTITVPANTAPVANAGPDQNAGQGSTVVFDGTGSSDAEGQPLSYQWTQTAGPPVALIAANTATPSFVVPTIPNPTAIVFELVVSDGITSSAPDVLVIAAFPNSPPIVNAGTNATAAPGSNVTLSGTASDLESDPLTYQWTQVGGPAVTLNGATTLTPSFVAPAKTAAPQVLIFQLVANDGTSSSAPDTVEITIPGNVGPTANAGPDASAGGGTAVTLDGTGSSDGDGDALTYQWTQIGGPSVTLSGANTANPTFTAPPATTSAQSLVFELIVSDGIVSSAADTVTITIPDNAAPTVDAGPDATVTGSSSVTLAGTASDLENDPLTYQWTQVGGPAVTLNGATTLTPSFTAPAKSAAPQVLTFSITANDGTSTSTADTVDITIAANTDPVASAGNDVTFPGGSQVFLEGFGTDPDGDPLTLQWTQVAGPAVTLNDANTQNPNFVAPAKTNAAQVLTFSLTVADGIASSAADTVDVTIPANIGPQADAGADATVNGGATVTLDGSASADGDGDPLTYAWVQTAGTSVALSDATAAAPSFVAPAAQATAQALSFDLVVSDGLTTSVADSVTITVAANSPPVANAGIDQGPINSGATVTLNGTGSSDPDGDPLTFTWTQVSGPAVTLSDPASASPSFTAPNVQGLQDLVFSLVVSDGQATSSADTVTIGIRGVGTVTIIQRVIGSDSSFTYTSSIAALNGTIATSNGTGQLAATGVAAGSHTVSVGDLSAAGLALTDISCNDTDSVVSLPNRSVAIALSPNEDLVCTFTSANSRESAVTAINNFLTGRNALILSLQPDLQRRLDRLNPSEGAGGSATAFGLPVPGSGHLPFAVSLGSGQARVSTSLAMAAAATGDPDRGKQPFDIWGEAYFADTRIGAQEGNFQIFHIGADYRVGSDLLLGVLAQFDDFNDKGTLLAGEAEGNGWMVGPYAMARLGDGLFAELRGAWGSSDNLVSPLGTYTDGFDTNRAFYSGSLIGQFDLGEATQIRPEMTVRYLSETAREYVDSLAITIPGQTVSQGDISFRPRIQHRVDLDDGWSIRPFAEIEGIYTFGTELNAVLDNGLRARIEGGIDLFGAGSFRSSLSAFHDGIGSENFRATGVHASVSFGF